MSEGTPAPSAAAARPGRKQICGRLRAVVRDLPRLHPGGAGADYVDACATSGSTGYCWAVFRTGCAPT